MAAPDHAGDDAPVHGEEAEGSERRHTVDLPQEMSQLALDQLCVGFRVTGGQIAKLLLQGNCQTLHIGVNILHNCTHTLDPDKG